MQFGGLRDGSRQPPAQNLRLDGVNAGKCRVTLSQEFPITGTDVRVWTSTKSADNNPPNACVGHQPRQENSSGSYQAKVFAVTE